MNFDSFCYQHLAEAGLAPARNIQILADGEIHRYQVEGDRNSSLNGWYVCYGSDVLVAGSWKTGQKVVVHSRRFSELSPEQRKLREEQVAKAQSQAKSEKRKRQEQVAKKVQAEWEKAQPATFAHPYLLKKQIPPYGIRELGDTLLIPARDEAGKLWSLQYIKPNGRKLFAKGGRIDGCFHLIGQVTDQLYFAEGYSTAATLHKFMGLTMAVAFNAGNLRQAAMQLRKIYPKAKFIFAADNDRTAKVNTGLKKAREAAEAVKGKVIWPDFPEGVEGTDFNDLVVNGGCLDE
ncbi:toprim domain-containing protein [Endozoicomonas sp. ONNA1]|uniref:toprim domain-containing protein n=1 Tax=Endozoicomonas sp. ONNA1 TaxID=2828740 RepID=UPI00214755E9|nr:toprim domain-containing protein [Endozoicomonas sp. ONNA1]